MPLDQRFLIILGVAFILVVGSLVFALNTINPFTGEDGVEPQPETPTETPAETGAREGDGLVVTGLELTVVDGSVLKIDDFRGSYVIVWLMLPVGCPICVSQAGELREFFQEYEGDDVVVVMVSVLDYDGVEKDILAFKEKNGLPDWIPALDTVGLGVMLDIPEMGVVVIGPNGEIVYKGVPSASSEELLDVIMSHGWA